MASPASTEAERPSGSLVVVRTVDEITSETFVRITADGSVSAYNGHVDLGTGIRTALGQIVAEELDVSFARVVVVLGDTAIVPNQGATIASETVRRSGSHRALRNASESGSRRSAWSGDTRRKATSGRSENSSATHTPTPSPTRIAIGARRTSTSTGRKSLSA